MTATEPGKAATDDLDIVGEAFLACPGRRATTSLDPNGPAPAHTVTSLGQLPALLERASPG
jgi:hypothetical protein